MTIYSAHVGNNAELFPQILDVYLPENSKILDATCGKGVFWRDVNRKKYHIILSDLKQGIDLANIPMPDDSLDGFVIDPPYMPTEYTGIKEFSDYYGIERQFADKKWHKAVLQNYYDGIDEANRLLKREGCLIVKCQDMVCANRQVLVHCDVIDYSKKYFTCEDIFVLVQSNRRPHPKKNQVHARKNHSYFLVFFKNEYKWKGLK